MRRLLLSALIATALAGPAAGQHFLYATAASQRRIDAFRVSGSGLPLGDPPAQQQNTAGKRPRRLIVNQARCVLYVAETDRVEVFRIHKNAQLDLIGATKTTIEMQAHDIELGPDGNMLYVPIRQQGTIAAYPLDAEGKPANVAPEPENGVPVGQPTSCIWSQTSAGFEDIEVTNGKLYVATTNRVNVYGIDGAGQLFGSARVPRDLDNDGDVDDEDRDVDDDGDIDQDDRDQWDCPSYSTVPDPDAPKNCVDPELRPKPKPKDLPSGSCPLSFRGHLNGSTGLIVRGTTLFVGERFTHVLQGFTLQDDGNFELISPNQTDPSYQPTPKEKKAERRSRRKTRPKDTIRYIGLTYFAPPSSAPIIYAAGFEGRVDAFRLDPDGTLPGTSTSGTPKNVVSTPVRTAIGDVGSGPTLYVAAGELDRVEAFKLFDQGAIGEGATPVTTVEQKGSFPNDVVLVDTSACD